MRLLIQIVESAGVLIDGEREEKISKGMLIFVGFSLSDTRNDVEEMIEKLFKLRIFSDGVKTNLSLDDVLGDLLCISQFTLYADTRKGNRPSFSNCMNRINAEPLYDYFVELIKKRKANAKFGKFGADMKVNLINDGPFTIMLETDGDKNEK